MVWVFLLAVPGGLVLLAMLRLLTARRFDPVIEICLSVVSTLLWIAVVLGTLATGNLLMIVILVVAAVVAGSNRRSRQDTLLWVLAIAVKKQMPLGPSVAALATEYRGTFSRRVQRLAELLNAGLPLEAAVARVPKILPPEGIIAIQIGAEVGVLERALSDTAETCTFQVPRWQSYCLRLLYLLGTMVALQIVTGFGMAFVVPKFRKIMADFGLDPPAPMEWLSLDQEPVFTLGFLLIAAEVLAIAYLILLLLGWVPPILIGLARRVDAAQILRLLALAIEAGRPLPLAPLARLYPRWAIRRRLRRVERDVQAGGSPWESLRKRGLIDRAEFAVLESALRAGNLPWALREMADGSERRLGYRLEGWTHVLFSLAVLSFAVPVAVYALACLLPLIEIIEVFVP